MAFRYRHFTSAFLKVSHASKSVRVDNQWRKNRHPPGERILRKWPCLAPICLPGEPSPGHRIPRDARRPDPCLRTTADKRRFGVASAGGESDPGSTPGSRVPARSGCRSRCSDMFGRRANSRRPRYRSLFPSSHPGIFAGSNVRSHRTGTPIAHGSSVPATSSSKRVGRSLEGWGACRESSPGLILFQGIYF